MRFLCALISVCMLAGCGGSSTSGVNGEASANVLTSLASVSDVQVAGITEGVTPFIYMVHLTGMGLGGMTSVSYTIAPKPGTVSKPVAVTFTADALSRRSPSPGSLAYATTVLPFSGTRAPGTLEIPVFGLYQGYANSVSVQISFTDGSVQTIPVEVDAAAYTDPSGIYDRPVFVKQRAPGSSLGFNFFAMKSNYGTPVIVDTDGEIRWVGGVGTASGEVSIFTDNGFVIGDQFSMTAYRLELDGSFTSTVLTEPGYTKFHHNIDPGKVGFLGEFDTVTNIESTIGEFSYPGGFDKEWNLAALLSDYMTSQGDDASLFVRPAVDWFHSNATTYDPSDNSIIVSSRENVLIKINYDTGAIIWILGDPTKYWYTFPSLRAKALTLANGGLYPIGQHGVSITSHGLVMVMNDGEQSANNPPGTSAGVQRTYSAVSAYAIDETAMTATEVWDFAYGQSIFSPICGSVYEAPGSTYLVDYATADKETEARVVGLDSNHNVVFDFQYASPPCQTSWNAVPIPLEQMVFQ